MRVPALVLVAAILLGSILFVEPASAAIEESADRTLGTFDDTEFLSNAFGGGVRLSQTIDAFSTNPFTSSPTRLYPAAANNYDSTNLALEIDPDNAQAAGTIWGATRCFETDNAAGCGTGTPAVADSVTPPSLLFSFRIRTYIRTTGFGTLTFGVINCPQYNTACQDNDDADATYLISATGPTRNYIGVRARKLADTNGFGFVADARDDAGATITSAATGNICAENTFCTVRGELVGGTFTVYVDGSSVLSIAITGVFTLNSIGIHYANVVGVQVGYRVDDMSLTYETDGTWETAAFSPTATITETRVALSQGGGARLVTEVDWREASSNLATYTADFTSTTTIEESGLATGSYVLLTVPSVRVLLEGDRVFTPIVTALSITYSSGGGGGGGSGIPGLPPDLDFRCDALTDADWLLPTAQVGSRTVTLYDRRSEAVLVREYLISWGDGRADIVGGLPVNHTYAEEGVYTITIRLALRTGEVQIFVARADVRGNNCALQMFAEDLFGPLIALAALALVVAIILTAKSLGYRLDPRKRRTQRIQRGLLGMALVSFGLVLVVAVYATIIGTPL